VFGEHYGTGFTRGGDGNIEELVHWIIVAPLRR
jgi:hypothetical protein